MDALEEMKARLRTRFLGRAGVHGIGLIRSRGVLRAYVDAAAPEPECGEVLEEMRRCAAPIPVEVVREERPRAG